MIKLGCVKNRVVVYVEGLMWFFCEFIEFLEDSEFGFCLYDMMLLDFVIIYGWLFFGVWDVGLDNVVDDIVNFMFYVIEVV